MDASSKPRFPWPLVIGLIGILVFFSCLAAAIFGSGAVLWVNRRAHGPVVTQAPLSLGETPASGLANSAASLQSTRGLVEVQDASGNWAATSQVQPLSAGQAVRTGALSGATLAFLDGSLVRLGAGTDLALQDLDFNNGRRVVLIQSSGDSDHSVAPAQADGSIYQVQTPDGNAEALGTRFSVAIQPERMVRFSVEDGSLSVTAQGETVILEAGQASSISAGEAPASPAMRIALEGAVQQIGETWIIAGQSFAVNEETSITGEPRQGDLVRVEGRAVAEGVPQADVISLLRAFPVNRFTLTGEAQVIDEAAWEVAGQTVGITTTTQIDPGIEVGDIVRVEGTILEDGGLLADQIAIFSEEEGYPFDFTGLVQNIEAGAWRISGILISIDDQTLIAEGLGVGDVARATGRILPDGTWLAHRISSAEQWFHPFEITGRLESLDPWRVAGINLQTRVWTEIQPGLATGDLVQVRGFIQEDGAWVAYQIQRIEETPYPLIVIIGRVISVDPWVVSGIPLNVTAETIIEGEITPGMLVRVEAYLLPDGSWQIVRITALDVFTGIPGCMNLNATVVGVDGDILRLLGWPKLEMDEDIRVEGDLRPNSIVLIQLCFDENGHLIIVLISLAYEPDDDSEPPDMGDKVTLCHKPYKKKGGHSITVSRSALPAHLGHGDYIGACSR